MSADQTLVFLFVWGIANLAIGGLIGVGKGRPVAGILWALFAGPIGWIVMLIVSDQRRKCPFCAEPVRREARVCPHCRRDLPAEILDKRLRPLARPRQAMDVDQVEQWAREHPEQAGDVSTFNAQR